MQPNEQQFQGLSNQEAQQRLAKEGRNELAKSKQRTWLTILLEVMLEPKFLLLICSSGIYILLGDTHEALMLLVMVLLVVGTAF